MIKRTCLMISMITCTVSLAMEYKSSRSPITKDIALTAQAAMQEGAVRKEIINRFAKNGIDITRETAANQTKLIRLGAIFLGVRTESNSLKIKRLLEYEKRKAYKALFAKYPDLSIALVELAQIQQPMVPKRKGKQE